MVLTLLAACATLCCVSALAFTNGFRVTGALCVMAAVGTLLWALWVGAVLLS